jgi:pilus assembly protein Flp/PilA
MVERERAMCGLTKLLRCEHGATAIEYALVASLISIAAIAAMNGLGGKIGTMYNNVGTKLN